MKNILEVKNLNMEYRTLEGNVKAIQDVSFNIPINSSFSTAGTNLIFEIVSLGALEQPVIMVRINS